MTTQPDLAELRRRHAALTPFALRFLSGGLVDEPYIALACEDGTPLPEPAFDAVLLFAELAAAELPALLDAAGERDALAAKVERVRRECVIGKSYAGWAAMSRAVLAILDEEPQP